MNRLPIPDDFIPPNYEDGSIANIPATIAAILGVQLDGLPSLPDALWRPLGDEIKRVITITIDGFGWNLLTKEKSFLQPLLQQAAVTDQITSIFPSTTVAALSSLWTGVAPAQHGLVGLNLFFPQYGSLGQMLSFTPVFGLYPDALVQAGLDPDTFLQWPGLAQQLDKAHIPTHAFKGEEIINSALSRMHGRGVAGDHAFVTPADMLVQLRRLLESTANDPLYVSAYLPTVDTLSHDYGWDGEIVAAELRSIISQLQSELLNRLTPQACRGTALLIIADHGHIVTPLEETIYLEDHPLLQQMLFMKPAGEPRLIYLYTKHGCQDDAIDYINERLGHAMVAWRAADLLDAGLLGPPPFAPQTAGRIGDVVIAMREGHVLMNSRAADEGNARRFKGRHGGMTPAEMIVPWLGFRLDEI